MEPRVASLTIHCPGCETLLELEISVVALDDWRCVRRCIGFAHVHRLSDHPVTEVTKHWILLPPVSAGDPAVRLEARARCSWSGALVVLTDEEEVRG
jgi:hypothetical protein